MYLFLIIFFTIYGGMNWYWYRKALPFLPPGLPLRVVSVLLLSALAVAPVVIRLLERRGYEAVATGAAWVGYSWMGFLFLCCSGFVLIDGLRLSCQLVERMGWGHPGRLFPGADVCFAGVCLAAGGIFLYGLFEAADLRTEVVDLYTTKIPRSAGTITIAQISDVHLGLLVGGKHLQRIVTVLREANPDLLVVTGDLVDGQIDGSQGLAQLFGTISPRFGKYAVTGNHERYAGGGQALGFLKSAGFTLLRGERVRIPGIMDIAGVDDPAFVDGAEAARQERTVLSHPRDEGYLLLLKHRPVVTPDSRGQFDLQLSGHVHKGQIFPFEYLTRLHFPLPTGLTGIDEGGAIYVSRGTGTWGPPIRVLAPPEVTIFHLRHP